MIYLWSYNWEFCLFKSFIIGIKSMKLLHSSLLIVSLLFLLHTGICSFGVYNLNALGQNNPTLLNISYSIANFGFVPYGKTIIARLMASPDFSKECTVTGSSTSYENSIMLIPRGDCEFVTKALNAQKLGAQMVVIMDETIHSQLVIMVDNNYGYKVKIPSIFINHKDGQQLRELLEDHPGNSVMMKVTFDNRKTQKADITFYLQANNRLSYRLVQDFRTFYPLVQSQLNLNIVHSIITCQKCREEDCYQGKTYCANNLMHEDSATGQLILDQQIREKIVFDFYPQEWWGYMKRIDDECAPISQLKECGEAAMRKEGIDPLKIQTEFKNGKLTYLGLNLNSLSLTGINKFPTVTLNSVKIKGSLNAELIFDDICNTLINPPDSCSKYTGTQLSVMEVSHSWWTLVLVVVCGVVIFSIIFVAYRRHMKRKISFEMQSRVDDMVSKYIEFYSDRANK